MVGVNLKERFSLHTLKVGKRLTQNAKGKFSILTRISWRAKFLPESIQGLLGWFFMKGRDLASSGS